MTELQRLEALARTGLIGAAPEDRFDRLTRLAANALNTEIALITLLETDKQWFMSRHGSEMTHTPRNQAFCNHTITYAEGMIVSDARSDARFKDNPLVCGAPNIGFYAGYPLVTKDGFALGSLCVIDTKARHDFTEQDMQTLKDIAASVMTEIESDKHEQTISDLNLMNEELHHRMGNMYAHISSLISLMDRSGEGDQKSFVKRLRNRIAVLAETQTLLATDDFHSAPISLIFSTALEPFLTKKNCDRIYVQSHDNFDVSSRGAFTLTLMLNELATNAMKHGALATDNGTIRFSWTRDRDIINFVWEETATIMKQSESTADHKGFGSQILKRIVPLDLQGDAEHTIRPEGLLYKVSGKWNRVAKDMSADLHP